MSSLSRAFSYLIAAQFQAVGLILAAWWFGEWLNKHHPVSFNWYAVTFPVGVVAVGHTFYLVIRHALNEEKRRESGKVSTNHPLPKETS